MLMRWLCLQLCHFAFCHCHCHFAYWKLHLVVIVISAQERGLIGNWKVTRPRDLIFCGGGFASTTIHDLCRMLPETENGKFLIKGGPEPGIFPHVMTNVPWQQPMTMM